jgi:hypothetical protein
MADAEAGHLLPVLTFDNRGMLRRYHRPYLGYAAAGVFDHGVYYRSSTGLLVGGVLRIRPCQIFVFPAEYCDVCA